MLADSAYRLDSFQDPLLGDLNATWFARFEKLVRLLKTVEDQFTDRFKRREYAEPFRSNRFETRYLALVQLTLHTLDRHSVGKVALVVLQNPRNVIESKAILGKVFDHVLKRVDVVLRSHDIRVSYEDNAVNTVQNELTAGVVLDLTGNRI